MLEVLEPGLQSTIQDGGRSAVAHLGLRRAGAADRRAHVASTLLVRGHPDDAAIEMTLLGARFAVRRSCVIGLAGADITWAPDARRQAIVDSWPADVDDGPARRDWGFAPAHDLERGFHEYLVPGIARRYAGR